MSSLAWIDFDEAERQRAQRIMELFQERETRDELGLGAIRDSIADHLFPGTSTIQTRLRYMLFIPWLFQMIEGSSVGSDQLAREARSLEIRLVNALKAGGESNGVIGRDAGANLQRLPSSVYWAGLGSWGIRLFPGSTDNLFTSMRHLQRSRPRVRESEDAASERQALQIWTPTLPQCPNDLLDAAHFKLSSDEAQFVVDRLVATHPDSLLTFLARSGDGEAECDNIWEHPQLANFPAVPRRLVEHAALFSSVMHGASLLYNLLLSRLRDRSEWIERYETRLADWRAGLDMAAIRAWSLDAFWQAIEHPAHGIRPAAKRFVTDWLGLLTSEGIGDSLTAPASRLVQERERRLKTNQSRFVNRAVRDRWTGASGAEPLSFRWSQAHSHLRDLAHVE
ncbi:DUF6361 family protein [Sphingobium cloacae]|uniref:Uncharacterized protein n=2 Tax=Sphingobium cloacae TaxID=120107 RepID=A0A1E1F500_9SPHN|nr:DUF6361 family protein [Sphingobium cloacae]BAV65511.1 hypothetical protein SCLO_1024710 [Sphingobium cloacae]